MLKILNISDNYINKLMPLKDVRFPHLLELNIGGNRVQSLDVINLCDFGKLEILILGNYCDMLDNNKLSSLECLKECSLYRLKVLSFANNFIKSI